VLVQEMENPPGLATALAGFVWLAAEVGQRERAARLLGAVQALREAAASSGSTALEPTIALLQAGLGEQALAAALAQGRAMRLEEAVAEALKVEVT
jgi:hypothetical protein